MYFHFYSRWENCPFKSCIRDIDHRVFMLGLYFCWSYPSCSMRCRSSGKSTRPYQSSTYSEINDKLEWIINTMHTILLKAKTINVDFCKRTCFNLSIISNVYLFLWQNLANVFWQVSQVFVEGIRTYNLLSRSRSYEK